MPPLCPSLLLRLPLTVRTRPCQSKPIGVAGGRSKLSARKGKKEKRDVCVCVCVYVNGTGKTSQLEW